VSTERDEQWLVPRLRLAALPNRAHGETWRRNLRRGEVCGGSPRYILPSLGHRANRQAAWLMSWYFLQIPRLSVVGEGCWWREQASSG
jgi:hypothetical protein